MRQQTLTNKRIAWLGFALISVFISATIAAEQTTTDAQFCIGCHEDNPMHGTHAGELFGSTNLVAECSACHGTVQDIDLHKQDGSDLIRFGWMQSEIVDQNGQCLNCHEGKNLGLAHWTHDAHGEGLACSSCHSLHPANDPVRGLTDKATIQLCVDCHSKQTIADEGVLK